MYYEVTIEVTKNQYDVLVNKAKALGVERDGGITLVKGIYELTLDADTKDRLYAVTDEVFNWKFIRPSIQKVA